MQCSAVCMCLLKLAECPQCVMVMQDMQKKAGRSTHSVRDEWGVTAAAQVDRAIARAARLHISSSDACAFVLIGRRCYSRADDCLDTMQMTPSSLLKCALATSAIILNDVSTAYVRSGGREAQQHAASI